MAIRIIDLTNADPYFSKVATLDGTDFILEFQWNEREARHYCSLKDAAGTELVGATKVVVDTPWLVHETSASMPAGQLWFIDSTGAGIDPGLLDLGRRVQLMYVEEANVT
ncbi:hypothetical protein KKD03_05675 [Patescibacteria group bacterium]|nr:hypothetical protein [Patescibacteria group bacterium]